MNRLKGTLTPIDISKLEVWREANVRRHDIFEGIEELAQNIKENGLQVPLIVWEKIHDKNYQIISGQRRYHACKMVRYSPVECLVVEKPDLEKAKILSLSENLYRRTMTPDDISDACSYLYNRIRNIKEIGDKLGVSSSTVRKYLGYGKVPKELKKLVSEKKITASQALRIYTQFPDKNQQIKIARELSRINDRVEKSKFYEAVKDSTPGESSTKLHERARKKKESLTMTIEVPHKTSQIIKKTADEMQVEPEFVILEIIERWIESHQKTGQSVIV
jgi:ParB family chromosome partitioning protein